MRQADLEACYLRHRRRDPDAAGTVRALLRFGQERSLLPATPLPVTRVATLAKIYGAALDDLRGLAPGTIQQHVTTAAQFLTHLDYEIAPEHLAAIESSDVEAFSRRVPDSRSLARFRHDQGSPIRAG